MGDPTSQALIDAARTYDAVFVPALFNQWAPKVADAADIQPGQRVLDVACGTGCLAREVASRAGSDGAVIGVDRNPGMVAIAKQRAPTIEWLEGVAESLPFPDHSFDAVVSQFGLMFFTDRRQALREMLRVLAPGGRLAVAVWDSLDSMPAYANEVELLDQTVGRQAADALRSPFVLGDRTQLAALFSDVGVSSAEINTHHGTAQFPSIRTMVEADLRGWLPAVGVVLTEAQIRRILDAADKALSPYASADGKAVFPLSVHLVSVSV